MTALEPGQRPPPDFSAELAAGARVALEKEAERQRMFAKLRADAQARLDARAAAENAAEACLLYTSPSPRD